MVVEEVVVEIVVVVLVDNNQCVFRHRDRVGVGKLWLLWMLLLLFWK